MSRADLASLLLLASHLAVFTSGYFLRRALPRRPDLAPSQRRRKRCPLCRQFVGAPPHRCPNRYAAR